MSKPRAADEDAKEYFNDDMFMPTLLADEILAETVKNHLVTPITPRGGDTVWKYHPEDGIYKPDGISWVEECASFRLGQFARSGRIKEVVKLVMIGSYTDPEHFEENKDVIVLENGVYDLKTYRLLMHNSIFNAKSKLPIRYNPEAECPKILKFLTEVIPNDISTFQEWLGYHFLRYYKFQKALMLIGDGENGKTTLQRLMAKFLGDENCSHVSLYDLISSRFASSQLHNKLGNISPDLSTDELKRTGSFKSATGNDRIKGERKYREPFYFVNYAKLTFLCNKLPQTPDMTRAFFRRWLLVVCPNSFVGENCDPDILEKITTEDELSGLFNWVIIGLKRLLEQGKFTKSESADITQLRYEEMSNPLVAFFRSCVRLNPDGMITKDQFYNAYYGFSKAKGFSPMLKNTFGKEIKPIIPLMTEGRRGPTGNRKTVWLGIDMRCEGCQGCVGSISNDGTLLGFMYEGVNHLEVC